MQAPGIERLPPPTRGAPILAAPMPQHAPPLEEIERQFLTEFDYRAEAANLAETRAFLLPKWRHKVDVPKPFHELCTKEVLVMSKLPGKKLVDDVREGSPRPPPREDWTPGRWNRRRWRPSPPAF